MDVTWLMLSMVYNTVGLGMFIYGKKMVSFVPLIAGLLLMIVPYFLDTLWMNVACLALMASPFVVGYFDG